MKLNKKKRILLAIPVVIVVLVVVALIMTAPKYAQIDPNVPVGVDVMMTSQGTPLAASFLMPQGATGPVPGVVMITGSGSFTYRTSWRPDEFPMWKNITEAFLAKGWAVLLLEKKGVNKSGGHWETQDFHDRADDAVVGVRYLKTRPEIDPARVGVCGHSQGGWISQLAAAEYPGEVAFAVSLAGPNISVIQQIIDDQANEWRCKGVSEEKVAGKSKWLRTKLNLLGAMSRVVKLGPLGHLINYDPEKLKVAARIKCPILAIYGEYDALVEPKGNVPLLEKGLAAGGNTRGTIVIIPRGSHGFIRKDGICPQQFKDIPGQAPELFAAIASWDPFKSGTQY